MEQSSEQGYRRRVLSGLAWLGSAQLVGQVVSWASTIFVIRLLSPEDYGLMAIATLCVSLVLILSDLGVGAALIQAESLDKRDLEAIQGFVLAFNVAGFAATLLAAPIVAGFFEEPDLVPIMRVVSLGFLLLAAYIVPQSRLVRDMRFQVKAKVDLITLILSAATSLTAAWLGFGVWALVGGALVTHLSRAIGFNWVLREVSTPRWSVDRGARFMRFGSVIVLDRILWFLYSNMDVAIAGRFLGTELLGFYTVALTLAATPLDKVMPVLTQVAFPAVARIQREPERVRRNMLMALRYGNLIFLPVFWGMALVAGDALPLLLGPQWVSAVVPFQMICVILPLKALGALLPPALFGLGHPKVNVMNMAVSLVLLSAGFAAGARWGLVGLSAAWLIVFPLVFVITTGRAFSTIGLRWRDVVDGWRGPWIAAAAMTLAVLGLQALAADWSPVVRLSSGIAVGAAVYVLSILAVDRSATVELRELLAR